MDGWFVLALLFLASSLAFGAGWNLRTHVYERRAYREQVSQRFEEQCSWPHPVEVTRAQMEAFLVRRKQRMMEQEWSA